jgi:hypothetical protein
MKHVMQSILAELRAAEWIPVTAARVLTGVFFCISGGTKLLVPSRFREMQETMIQSHIPFSHASALLVSLVEFACGGGLVLGLLKHDWPECRRHRGEAEELARMVASSNIRLIPMSYRALWEEWELAGSAPHLPLLKVRYSRTV